MRRRFVRPVAIALAAPLVAFALFALAWPWLAPRAVGAAIARIEQSTGARIAAHGTVVAFDGLALLVTLDRVAVERGSLSLRCNDLRATASLGEVVGGARLHDLHIASCELSRTADSEVADADGSGAAQAVPDPAPLLDVFDSLSDRVGRVDIDTVRADLPAGVSGVDAVAVDLSVRPRTLSLVVRGGPADDARVYLEVFDDELVWISAETLHLAGASVVPGRSTVSRGGSLRVDEAVVTGEGSGIAVEVAVRSIVVDGPRSRPHIVVEAPHATVHRQAAPDAAEVEEPAVAAPGAMPPPADAEAAPTDDPTAPGRPQVGIPVAAALDAVVTRITALLDHASRVANTALPSADITVNAAEIELIDGWLLHVPSVRWDGEGRIVGELAAGDVTGRFDIELLRSRHAHLEIAGVRLSDLLPAGAPFEGTTGIVADLKLEETGVVASIDLSLEEVTVTLPAVAAEPMADINAQLSLQASARTGDATRVSLTASGTVNELPLDLTLTADRLAGAWTVAFGGGFSESTPCNTAWQAIPEALIPNLGRQGVNFDGAAQLRIAVQWALNDPQSFELTTEGFPGTCVVDRIRRPYDPRVLNDDSYVHHVVEGVTSPDIFVGPGTDSYVRLNDLPSYVPAVMYLSEEIAFYTNPGISIGLMNRGMRLNIERGRYAYGGSTVSQQLVKNLFLTRSKTLSRKLEEAVIAWGMETWVTKDRILELYLNCIEFGPNIYGVRNAAFHYFGRGPETLTPLEAAWLANLKPSPASGARYLLRGNSAESGWWPERLGELLMRLHTYGNHISAEEAAYYAPYVVALPMSPAAESSPWRPIPRPLWAATDPARVFFRSGGDVVPPAEPASVDTLR